MEGAPQSSQAAFSNLLLQGLHLAPGTSTWHVPGVGQERGLQPPPPHAAPSVSGGPLMRTPPHILLLKVRHSTGWKVPHSCELVSPPHHPELSQAPGTARLARGEPSSTRAAPLPGHCWPRGDRAEAEGISLRRSPLLQTHTRAAKPHSPARAPAVPHPPGSIPPIPPGCSTGSTMRQPGQALHEEDGEKRFLRHH